MTHTRPKSGRCAHRKYNLNCDEFDELVADYDARCALCAITGPEAPHGFLVIDHDFRYGDWAIRGLLCSRCNSTIDAVGHVRTPKEEAYLADPWWRRRFGRLGLPVELVPEPPVGTVVAIGCQQWERTGRGWEDFRCWPQSWRWLTVRHPPHEIRVIGERVALM